MSTFDAPPYASTNCRHYAYVHGCGADRGPTCARGVDLKGRGDTRPCLPPAKPHGLFSGHPGPLGLCTLRSDYSDAERAAWDAYMEARAMRLISALASLPPTDGPEDSGDHPCPNCQGGTLSWRRSSAQSSIGCTTPNCTGPVIYHTGRQT